MISKLALGTVQFGIPYGISNKKGQLEIEEINKILEFASKVGINTLDTARAYGVSEKVLGQALGDENAFNLITKISAGEDVENQFAESIKQLKVGGLYGVLFHDTDKALENTDSIKKLQSLKKKGLIEKIGFSLYQPEQLDKLFELGLEVQLVQLPYNILDQRFRKYFQELKKSGVEIHIRSAFLQGLFFINPEDLDSKFDELKPKLLKLRELAKQHDLPYSAIPLCFVLSDKLIDKVVIGVESLNNLKENVGSVSHLKSIESLMPELFKLEFNNSKMILPTNWK